MDAVIFWIILLVLYLILQGLGSSQKPEPKKRRAPGGDQPPERPGPPPGQTTQTAEPTARTPSRELDDALGEIRDLLGGPQTAPREQQPRPERRRQRQESQPTPRPAKTPRELPRSEKKQPRKPRPRPTLKPSRPKPESKRPKRRDPIQQDMGLGEISDKPQVQRGRGGIAAGISDTSELGDLDKLDLPSDEEIRRKRRAEAGINLLKRLRKAGTAQEAVLIAEVLGPPRSRHMSRDRLRDLTR